MEDEETGLNRVQDVCQKFRILEDQTVAHGLQEHEIQQHLAANKLKTQRVRQNLQVARKLQEEEDERNRQFTQRLRKQIEGMERDYAWKIQEELDQEEDKRHRQPKYREASSRSGRFVRERRQRHKEHEERKERAMGQNDEVSLDPWIFPAQQEICYGQPRSRKPYVGREMEEGAGWGESRREGGHRCDSSGSELGAGEAISNGSGHVKQLPTEQLGRPQSPAPGFYHVKQTQGTKQTCMEGIPHTLRTRSKPQLERHRTRPEGTQEAVIGKGRDGWKQECRSDWSYTEGSEYPVSKPVIAGGSPHLHIEDGFDSSRAVPSNHPVFTNGEGLHRSRQIASDSESHSKRNKRKRDAQGFRSRARSEGSYRPVRIRQNSKGVSQLYLQCKNHQETRHKHRGQGDPRSMGEPQIDHRSQLDIKQRANHLHYPLDPTERLKQEDRQKEENGHYPLAVKEREKQAHHPLAVGKKQARQSLAVNQKHAHRPLVVGDKPTHYPPRTKVKEKQVHFLLDPEKRIKPTHWPGTSKGKQVQHPLDLKGKEVHSPTAAKQKRVHFPLTVEEKEKHVQIPLVVKEKDVQTPLASKERKKLAHSPLAVKGNPIQYRMGNKDTEAIIDYLLDKRKENDLPSQKYLNKLPPAFRGNCSSEQGRGKPVEARSEKTRLSSSPAAGDTQENHTSPWRLHAEKDSVRNPSSNWPNASPGHRGGLHWRDELSQGATNGPKEVGRRKGLSSQQREPHWVRAHVDSIGDRSGRSKADHSQTRSPSKEQENKPRAGKQRASETRRNSPNGGSMTPRNGVTVPSWCSDETLKGLQAMELRKARLRKAVAEEKVTQVVRDEEFALNLLRKEMMALRMSEGRTQPCQSQTGEDSPGSQNKESPRGCSPSSVNVDWDEEMKVPKLAYF
ncbi:trichohyalin-like isoform X2 [Heterodontus francisci]|uniref:trichohyalin-like isoform X2 n=1 Tax=Heterodontus francisci TaxID=7792 RepID=UPI00355B01DF